MISKYPFVLIATSCLASPSVSQETDDIPGKIGYHTSDWGFSGPASVLSQLDNDDILKDPVYRFPQVDAAFESWQTTKKRLNEQKDIQFGFDYNTLS